MQRGTSPAGALVRAALIALCCVALLVSAAFAQNAAEADPPASGEAAEPETPPAGADAQEEQDLPPTVVDDTSPPPDEQEAEPEPPTVEPGPGNVAESSPGDDSADTPAAEPATATDPVAPTEDAPDGNVAEAGVPAETTEPGEQPLFTPTPPADAPPSSPVAAAAEPNAAEAPPAGTEAENLAESAADDEAVVSRIAEPPDPEYQLPHPAEIAGPVSGYVEPSLDIFVPELEVRPDRPALDSFYQPARGYLEDRPLPPLDVDETDEERVARSIEESLQLLDLAMEQRPDEGIQIPLPSGLMTFKASDSFTFDRRNSILTFVGDVELVFNDIAIWADLVEVDDGAATAYAKGFVAVQQADDIVYCDEAYINYDTQTLEMFWVEGNISGSMQNPNRGLRLYEPMYYEADRVYGSFDYMILEKAVITTCAPLCGSQRDYEIKSDKVHYKRNRSIVMHDVYLFLRDTKVGWVPMLAVPLPKEQRLTEEESDIQQEYGYRSGEGYYAKFGYTYSTRWVDEVSRPLLGAMILELMTEKGAGMGIKQDYFIPSLGVGTVKAYYKEDWPEEIATGLIGRKAADAGEEFEFSFGQDLNFSRSLTGALDLDRINTLRVSSVQSGSDYRTNTWRGTFTLNHRPSANTFGVTVSQYVDQSGNVDRTNPETTPKKTSDELTFTVNRKLSKEFQLNLSQTYFEKQYGLTVQNPTDKEGTVNASLRYTGDPDTSMRGYTSSLTYRKTGIDYDGEDYTEGNQSVNDQVPGLQINLPRDLLGEGSFFNNFSINAERLITGRRRDPQEAVRYQISVGGSEKTSFSRSADLSYGLSFRQYWYDTKDALFALRPNVTFTYDSHRWWNFKTSWNMNYRQGVRIPPTGSRETYSNTLSYQFNFTNRRSWRWGLTSGYDFKTRHPRSIISTFNWDSHRLFGLTHSVSYVFSAGSGGNPSHWDWGSSTVSATWRSPHINEEGYYNWLLATNLRFQTDYLERFRMDQVKATYAKHFQNGWSGDITGYYSYDPQTDADLEHVASMGFIKDVIKKIRVRKVNCCTTWEATWRRDNASSSNAFSLYLYLNALPQYPGMYVAENIAAEDEHYFLFPYEPLRNDILTDVVGIDASRYGGLF